MGRKPINIEELLPHRGSMLLIDRISHVDQNRAVTRSRVRKQWPLFDGQAVSPLVLIELGAQTGGICIGWAVINHFEAQPASGWLVGVKQCRFFIDVLPLCSEIETEVAMGHQYNTLREMLGTARIDSCLVGEMKLQVLLAEQ